MTTEPVEGERRILGLTTEAAIRLALIIILLVGSFLIVQAFILAVLWGVIIAVAVEPLYRKCCGLLGNRRKLTAFLMVLVALVVLVVPVFKFIDSLVDTSLGVAKQIKDGTLKLPVLPERVKSWPLVGDEIADGWAYARENTADAVDKYAPQLATLAKALFGFVGHLGLGVLQFVFAMILAGVFLATGESGDRFMRRLTVRVTDPERGNQIVDLATATVRSVAMGVVGVAAIQAALAGLGMWIADVPATGVWTLLVLLLAIVELPPLLVMLPVTLYVFSTHTTTPSVIFAVWAVLVSVADNFLKPLLLGRGVDVPMLVTLVGAIGGMIAFGVVGLFVGAVILALVYKLFLLWMAEGEPPAASQAEPKPA